MYAGANMGHPSREVGFAALEGFIAAQRVGLRSYLLAEGKCVLTFLPMYVADEHHFLIVQSAPPAPSSLKSISIGYCLPQPLTSHFSCHCLAPVAPEKGVTT
jgi:hypothetical protein